MTVIDPAKTTVISVGIETYQCGDEWSLPGAAAGAVRFVEWARACAVPPDRIILACSSLPGECPPVPEGVVSIEPTSSRLYDALVGLKDQTGDLLMLFWCGHGVVEKWKNRKLFLADASELAMKTFDVANLLKFLESLNGPNIPSQVTLIDACANYVEKESYAAQLVTGDLPADEPRYGVRQFAYFSAGQGEMAAYHKVTREATFSTAVLGWLETRGKGVLPPDEGALVTHIDACFDAREGALAQRPVYRLISPSTGEDRYYEDWPVSGAAFVAMTQSRIGLSPRQLRRLAEATAQLAARLGPRAQARLRVELELGSREDVTSAAAIAWACGQMRQVISGVLSEAESSDERLAIEGLHELYSRQVRIARVIAAITQVTSRQVREAYYRVVPAPGRPRPQNLEHALEIAAGHGLTGEHAPLTRLVAELEHVTGATVPDDWYKLATQSALDGLRARAREAGAGIGRLVIDLSGALQSAGSGGWPASVDGHLRPAGGKWGKITFPVEPTIASVQAAVQKLLTAAYEQGARFSVGFIAPRQLIDAVPETWEFGSIYGPLRPLWEDHPTSLHCAERRTDIELKSRWADRVSAVQLNVEGEEPRVLWLEADVRDDPRAIYRAMSQASHECYALRFAPSAFDGDYRRDGLMAAIATGAPFIVWADEQPEDWDVLNEELIEMLRTGFESVPDQLQTARANGGSATGSLRVLWDHPDRLPDYVSFTGVEEAAHD